MDWRISRMRTWKLLVLVTTPVALHFVKRVGSMVGKRVFATGSGPFGALVIAMAFPVTLSINSPAWKPISVQSTDTVVRVGKL